MKLASTSFALACLVLAAGLSPRPVSAADLLPNLVYESWSKSAVGDYVIVEKVEENGDGKTETRVRMELVSRTGSEVRFRMRIAQKTEKGWRQIQDDVQTVGRMISRAKGENQRKMDGAVDEGDERMKVAGHPVQAHWWLVSRKQSHGEHALDVYTKTIVSDEVPGRVVSIDQEVYLEGTETLMYVASTKVVQWSRKAAAPASR